MSKSAPFAILCVTCGLWLAISFSSQVRLDEFCLVELFELPRSFSQGKHPWRRPGKWNRGLQTFHRHIHINFIIKDSFKKLHMKSLRLASTKRIWKAIFIEETRSLCYAPSGIPKYFRSKCTSKVYFLGRNAHS